MVRAMDSADESWSEPEVVADARKRQGLLRAHLNRVAQARAQRMSALAQEIDDAKKNGDAVLAELDRRIADLYARRESEATATTTNVGKLVQKQKELEASESRSRQGVAQVIQALAGLLTFLGVPPGPEGS
jgi:predicted  nucleic acid-binding Zn-ribbon protein